MSDHVTIKEKVVQFSKQKYYDDLVKYGHIEIDGIPFDYSPEDTIYVTPSAIYLTDIKVASTDWIHNSRITEEREFIADEITPEDNPILSIEFSKNLYGDNPPIFSLKDSNGNEIEIPEGKVIIWEEEPLEIGLYEDFLESGTSYTITVTYDTEPDEKYEFYQYKAILDTPGVTPTSVVQVIFADEQVRSGDYCNPVEPGEDTVTIYSNNNSAIVIPSIISGEPAIVGISQSSGMHNYSTDEHIVGIWIDGKPLYEKTIVIASGDLVWTERLKSWEHHIDHFDFGFVHEVQGARTVDEDYIKNYSGYTLSRMNDTDQFRGIVWGINATYITGALTSANSFNNTTGYITVRYTKTTDTTEVNN